MLDCTGRCCTCSLANKSSVFPLSAEDSVVLLRHCRILCHSLTSSWGFSQYHYKAQLYSSLEKLRVSPKVTQLVVKWDAAGCVLL